jgi:fermentation-respiration switch protein FrsA (DUF1100 family)
MPKLSAAAFRLRSSIADVAAAQAQIWSPLLIVHGSSDDAVPIRFAERLFALASPRKQFIRVDGGGPLALGSRIEVLAWIDRTLE